MTARRRQRRGLIRFFTASDCRMMQNGTSGYHEPRRFPWPTVRQVVRNLRFLVRRLLAGISDCQWRDVLGVLKVQAGTLDRAYLREWAASLHLTDLLRRALDDAGLPPDP